MGTALFDNYTYLHFAVGVVIYYFGIKLLPWVVIHTAFEVGENTDIGMNFINKCLPFWPGGKTQADSLTNSIGDTIGAVLGWLSASYLDSLVGKGKIYANYFS